MKEEQWQRYRFVEFWRGKVPIRALNKIFKKCWHRFGGIGTIRDVADMMAETWLEAKGGN